MGTTALVILYKKSDVQERCCQVRGARGLKDKSGLIEENTVSHTKLSVGIIQRKLIYFSYKALKIDREMDKKDVIHIQWNVTQT